MLKQYGYKQLKWFKSSNSAIALVNPKGMIIAKKTGTAKITVNPSSGPAISVNVTVTNIKPLQVGSYKVDGGNTHRGLAAVKVRCANVTGGVKTYRYIWTVTDKATNKRVLYKNTTASSLSWKPSKYGNYRISCRLVDLAGGNVTKTADIVIKK